MKITHRKTTQEIVCVVSHSERETLLKAFRSDKNIFMMEFGFDFFRINKLEFSSLSTGPTLPESPYRTDGMFSCLLEIEQAEPDRIDEKTGLPYAKTLRQ